jgi:hypothetical protein
MKLLVGIFVSALALCAADPQTSGAAPQKNAAKPAVKKSAAKPAQQLTIPTGAVQNADGDFPYTDPQGKKWLYRNTPFGVSRREDTGEASTAKSTTSDAAGMKATEDGDIVHFEKPGPFGPWKWDKKKSDLDDSEKAALQQAQASKLASK